MEGLLAFGGIMLLIGSLVLFGFIYSKYLDWKMKKENKKFEAEYADFLALHKEYRKAIDVCWDFRNKKEKLKEQIEEAQKELNCLPLKSKSFDEQNNEIERLRYTYVNCGNYLILARQQQTSWAEKLNASEKKPKNYDRIFH